MYRVCYWKDLSAFAPLVVTVHSVTVFPEELRLMHYTRVLLLQLRVQFLQSSVKIPFHVLVLI